MMEYQELFSEFTRKFADHDINYRPRGIGIEMEFPVVDGNGEAIGIPIVQGMFEFLEDEDFQLKRDNFSNYITSASRINDRSSQNFGYHLDTITTDAGSGILEVILAPQDNLHAIQHRFSEVMSLLARYFDTKNCSILGYGIQPLSPPSRKLLMPKERYFFYENFSSNNIVPSSEGSDAHLLAMTASNQCHISIGQNEAISAVNVLNALSGPQIILHANSPIWQGRLNLVYKAHREVFWEYCYPERLGQMGIPPKFRTMDDYIDYLLAFKPMLVRRTKLLQILNKPTFKDFMFDGSPTIGKALNGKEFIIQPKIKDIHYLNSFCYFNARLVPKFGTIESRMCCQQPFAAALAPTAVTLGILENLEDAKEIADRYSPRIWKKLRADAIQHAFKTSLPGKSIRSFLTRFLEIAKQGLQRRGLGEEIFLKPLYERLNLHRSPADEAIDVFEKYGMRGLLEYCTLNN